MKIKIKKKYINEEEGTLDPSTLVQSGDGTPTASPENDNKKDEQSDAESTAQNGDTNASVGSVNGAEYGENPSTNISDDQEQKDEDVSSESSAEQPEEPTQELANTERLCLFYYTTRAKKSAMYCLIIMPSFCSQDFVIDKAPIDLRDLMQDIPNSKTKNGEKFLNIRGMLHDPTKTYNAASDYAKNIFKDIDNLKDSGSIPTYKADESYSYSDGAYMLNEDALATVVGGAAVAGKAASNIMLGSLAAAGSFLTNAAPGMAAIFGTAGAATLMFSDVKEGGIVADGDLRNSHEDTEDRSNDISDKNLKNQNAIEAIDLYLTKLGNSLPSLFSDLVGSNQDFKKIKTTIDTYISESDKNISEYLKSNSEMMKKIREEKRNRTLNTLNSVKTSMQMVSELMPKLLNPNNGGNTKTVQSLSSAILLLAYNATSENSNLEALEKLSEMQAKDIINMFSDGDKITSSAIKKRLNATETEESVSLPLFQNKLFEEENKNDSKRDPINLVPYYKRIRSTFSNLISPLFDQEKGEASKLPMVQDANKRMDALIEAATKEITTKIEHVCRISNDGKNNDLPANISGFISKHPMKAASLTDMWARHVDDLKGRKQARLVLMTDFGNISYVPGWAAYFCKEIVPEVIARMFTYRYALQLLLNEDFYTFDSNAEKDLRDSFLENKEDLMDSLRYKMLIALYSNGNGYTDDLKPIINLDENSKLGFSLNTASNINTTFLVLALLDDDDYVKPCQDKNYSFVSTGTAVSKNLRDNMSDIDTFIDAMLQLASIAGLDENNDNINKDLDDGDPTKIGIDIERIKKGYEEILNLVTAADTSINEMDFQKTIYFVSEKKDVIENLDEDRVKDIQDKINEYKKNNDAEAYVSELRDALGVTADDIPIKNVYAGRPIGAGLFIKDLKSNTNLDYLGYILFIYEALHLDDVFDYEKTGILDHLNDIIDVTYNVLFLLTTNALNLGNETPDWIEKILPYIDGYSDSDMNIESLLDLCDESEDDDEKSIASNVLKCEDHEKVEGDIKSKIDNNLDNSKNAFDNLLKQNVDGENDTVKNFVLELKTIDFNKILESLKKFKIGSREIDSFKKLLESNTNDVLFVGTDEDLNNVIIGLKTIILDAYCESRDKNNDLYEIYKNINIVCKELKWADEEKDKLADNAIEEYKEVVNILAKQYQKIKLELARVSNVNNADTIMELFTTKFADKDGFNTHIANDADLKSMDQKTLCNEYNSKQSVLYKDINGLNTILNAAE